MLRPSVGGTPKPKNLKDNPATPTPNPAKQNTPNPMAIAFAELKSISRADKNKSGGYTSKGRSSVAASAYRAGLKLTDEITGIVHDYTTRTKNGGVVEALPVIVPAGEPGIERGELWNKVEKAETRTNSMLAREIVIALPRETSPEANRRLAQSVGEKLAKEFGVAVDVCIHAGGKKDHDGAENPHLHVMFTTRRYKVGELGEKTRELNDKRTSSGHVEDLRQFWQAACNKELEAIQVKGIDMRSYQRQGIDKIPQRHLGKNAFHHHRRTGQNRLATHNDLIASANLRNERVKLERVADKAFNIADRFERMAARLEAEAKGAAPAASSPPKEEPKPGTVAGESRPQAAERVAPARISQGPDADSRAKGMHAALAEFLAGGGETKEIRSAERATLREALRACSTTETAPNLELLDALGNKLPHLFAATVRRLQERANKADAAELREVREVGTLLGSVKSAGASAGYRFDVKARNLDGQNSFDVQQQGLKTPPPRPVMAASKYRATCVDGWAIGERTRGTLGAAGRVPALRSIRQQPPARTMFARPQMQLVKRFGPPAPSGFAPASSVSSPSGAFGSVGNATAYGGGGGGQRAAGGMQPPPPGLPPQEAAAWMAMYKRAVEVQRSADEEKRRRPTR